MLLLGVIIAAVTSCNSKTDEIADDYVSTESVAVTNFRLNPNISIMKNLDSVYFSIDLAHGVIFNADSLPKGTRINKLIPKISYPSTVTSATLTMTGGTTREGTVNYLTNPSDTIDFTGKVTLELKAGEISKTYVLKVNVHNVESDTLIWENLAVTNTLPSRMENPKSQKTVGNEGTTTSLIEERDGSFTLAVCKDLFEGTWNKEKIQPGFTPKVETFSHCEAGYYVLSTSSELYSSNDGRNWNDCSMKWTNIIGGYENYVLGLETSGSNVSMVSYPAGLSTSNLPAEFPISGFSTPIVTKSAWSSNSTLMIFGGKTASGAYSDGAWAFDGTTWANLADRPLPALDGVQVFPYYTYLRATAGGEREIATMVALGGELADGTVNRDVYISYNNGLSWVKGAEYLQLPESIDLGSGGDVIVSTKGMEYNISNNWTAVNPRRVKYEIDGDLVKWECPYIFIFGGYDTKGRLIEKVRCGVLRRLTFAPLF